MRNNKKDMQNKTNKTNEKFFLKLSIGTQTSRENYFQRSTLFEDYFSNI